MENRINQIIVLGNDKKYIILKQAIYNNDNYYVAARVTEDEEDVTNEFAMLHEVNKDGNLFVEIVTDPAVMQILLKHLDIKE